LSFLVDCGFDPRLGHRARRKNCAGRLIYRAGWRAFLKSLPREEKERENSFLCNRRLRPEERRPPMATKISEEFGC
jgi:hypothetical protein